MKLRIKAERKIPDVVVSPSQPVQQIKKYEICTRGKQRKATGTLRSCHLDIIFLEDGIFLRACEEWKKPGLLIPVKSHAEAQRVAKRFCACRKGGKSPRKCATEAGWDGEALGGR